jgi:hypothetical protein
LNEDWAGKPAYSEANNIKSREVETMTRKITKSGSNSRSRLLTTVSAGAAVAASPFRINCCKSGCDAFSL